MSSEGGGGDRARPRPERHDSDQGWAAGGARLESFAWAPGGAGGASPFHPVVRHGRPIVVAVVAAVLVVGAAMAAPALPDLQAVTGDVEGAFEGGDGTERGDVEQPTDTASPTVSPTATPTPTRSPTPTATATASPTATPTATATPTPSPTLTRAPTPSPTVVPSNEQSGGGGWSPPPTATRTPTPTDSPTATPTDTPTATPTDTPTPTESPTTTDGGGGILPLGTVSLDVPRAISFLTLGLGAVVLGRRD